MRPRLPDIGFLIFIACIATSCALYDLMILDMLRHR